VWCCASFSLRRVKSHIEANSLQMEQAIPCTRFQTHYDYIYLYLIYLYELQTHTFLGKTKTFLFVHGIWGVQSLHIVARWKPGNLGLTGWKKGTSFEESNHMSKMIWRWDYDYWWFRNPVNSPVEVGSLFHFLQFFLQVVVWFLNQQQYEHGTNMGRLTSLSAMSFCFIETPSNINSVNI